MACVCASLSWKRVPSSHADQQSALEANGKISREQAYALVSTNIEKILGLDDIADGGLDDLVAFDGGSSFEFSSKVVAVLSPQRGFVEVFSG